MRDLFKTFLVVIAFLSSTISNGQDLFKEFEHLFVTPRNYVAYKTTSTIKIDGQAKEKDWSHAKWSDIFIDIEGDKKPKPLHDTRVKMLWDENNLYILAELEEPHIWAYYTKNDMIVYHENDFEVFIDPDRDTHNYYEFEVNAQNTLFDLFMNKPYRNGGGANIPWNAEGFKSAVHLDGTLNDPSDKDKKWTVEMVIPFSSLTTTGDFIQPTNDDVWKINFSRVQWQTKVENGKYVKKINPETGKHFPEDNWVWSQQGVINMHYPERWSMVQFSGQSPKKGKDTFQLPVEEEFAKYLWIVYYKQRAYSREHKGYAQGLSALNIPETGNHNGTSYRLELQTDGKKYTTKLHAANGLSISLNQEGLFKVLKK